MLNISHGFDAGAIEVLAAERADDLRVNIRADSHAEFRQWFYFRLQGARGQACSIRFANAGQCTYVDGWLDYRAMASYDRRRWFRVPTRFDGAEMIVAHTPERDSIWYAYFEPFSWERHLDLLGRAEDSPIGRVRRLGSTIDGRDLDLVTVGEPGTGKRSLWVIARQHPGETMAEWFVEGLLERLLDPYDPTARSLLRDAVVHVVPNMNPDGSVRQLRTNAAGANSTASGRRRASNAARKSCARGDQAGSVDAFSTCMATRLAVRLRQGCDRTAAPKRDALQRVRRRVPAREADFQVHGYPDDKDKVNLSLASKYVGHSYGCLALTLEMPFKDNADLRDPEVGWNGERSKRLGAAAVEALLAVLPDL